MDFWGVPICGEILIHCTGGTAKDTILSGYLMTWWRFIIYYLSFLVVQEDVILSLFFLFLRTDSNALAGVWLHHPGLPSSSSRSFDDIVRWFRGSRVRELHAFSFEIGSTEMWCLDMFGYVWWILQKIPSCFVVRCCFEVTNERPRCVLCKGKWHFFFAMFANMSLIDAFHILSWRMCLWRHANVHRMTGPQLVAILTK